MKFAELMHDKSVNLLITDHNSYTKQGDKTWCSEELTTFTSEYFKDYDVVSIQVDKTGKTLTLSKKEDILSKKDFLLFARDDIYEDIIVKHKIPITIRMLQELCKLTNDIYEKGRDKWQEDSTIAMSILSFLRLLDKDPNRYMEEFYEIIEGDFI